MPESKLKFCKDCRWAVANFGDNSDVWYSCRHEFISHVDVVDGERKPYDCHRARANEGLCGLSGKRWEARDG